MMKIFWIILTAFISTQGYTQVLNQKTIDEKKHQEILVGYCTREGFVTCSFDSAYQAGYGPYTPDTAAMRLLSPGMNEITIKLVMGTWCGDSKDQVPHFYKILDLLKFDFSKLSLICVDRTKAAPGIDLAPLSINLVPTFIFYRNDKEIGRIIETPTISLEKDMLRIIGKAD
jgi:thiol-disulfide isomerase/thioredoxin